MAVDAVILITTVCDDIDKANDWAEEVLDLLKDNVTGTFQSKISNSSPSEELTEDEPDG